MNNEKAYAKALMDLSKEYNIDKKQIVEQLQYVWQYFDDEFLNFLKNPRISKEDKKEIFKKAFSNLNKHVFYTLMVLIDNDNIVNLNNIINEFISMVDDELGIISLELYTVKPLNDIEKNNIKNYFSKKLQKNINLVEIIDANLIGGLIIKYQGKIIDGSIFSKQESLKEHLKK